MIPVHQKPWKFVTQLIIWTMLAFLGIYDVVAALLHKLTLSEVIQPSLLNHIPAFAAAFFLMGHLAWPQYIERSHEKEVGTKLKDPRDTDPED